MFRCPRPFLMSGPSAKLAAFWIGLLRSSSREQYTAALNIFTTWAKTMAPNFWSQDEESQDYVLAEYVLECRDGEVLAPQHCSTVIAAVQRCFGRRRKYSAAALTVEGWRSGLEIRQAPPMPAAVVYACASIMIAAGRAECAGVLLLCFSGLLRISEGLALRGLDVLLPSEHLMGPFLLLLLRTGKRDAPDSSRVVISAPAIVEWLVEFKTARCQGAEASDRLFGVSYSTFRKWMRRSIACLGFEPGYYTSHSLRRGGATEMARAGVPLMDVMIFGRWASLSSFKLYIAKGEVALTRLRQDLTTEKWSAIERLATLILVALRHF